MAAKGELAVPDDVLAHVCALLGVRDHCLRLRLVSRQFARVCRLAAAWPAALSLVRRPLTMAAAHSLRCARPTHLAMTTALARVETYAAWRLWAPVLQRVQVLMLVRCTSALLGQALAALGQVATLGEDRDLRLRRLVLHDASVKLSLLTRTLPATVGATLEALTLTHNKRLDGPQLARVCRGLPALTELDVCGTHAAPPLLDVLPVGMRTLRIGECAAFVSLVGIERLTALERLDARCRGVQDIGLGPADIERLNRLPSLAVLYASVQCSGPFPVVGPCLRLLVLDGCHTGSDCDAAAPALEIAPACGPSQQMTLTRLEVSGVHWSWQPAGLARFPALTDVALLHCEMRGAAIGAELGSLPALARLLLAHSTVDDAWLAQLAPCRALARLDLNGCLALTPAALLPLAPVGAALQQLRLPAHRGGPADSEAAQALLRHWALGAARLVLVRARTALPEALCHEALAQAGVAASLLPPLPVIPAH